MHLAQRRCRCTAGEEGCWRLLGAVAGRQGAATVARSVAASVMVRCRLMRSQRLVGGADDEERCSEVWFGVA
jgi:hypothetical protein